MFLLSRRRTSTCRLSRTLKEVFASHRKPRGGMPRWVECLEARTLLSAYLYLDYGDNFAGGVLNTTTDALFSHTVNGTNINGPQLSDSAGITTPPARPCN